MSAPTPTGQQPMPGRIMSGEMAEQPAVLRRILDEGAPRIRRIAEQIAARNPRFVLLTARGTSDNAALYAKYLVEVVLGKPAGLTSMSTTTAYGARPDLTDCLVVTVSQSGGSPDLVASTRAAREAGAITLAVTNNAGFAAGGGLRVPHRRAGRTGEGAARRPRRTRPSCSRCTCSSRACGAATAAPRRSCRSSRSRSSPARTRSGRSRRAIASPSAWCSPRAATATRPRRRPR